MPRVWTPQDDTFIIDTINKEGLNKSSTRKLRNHFKCNRHVLRGRLNALALTAYGRRQLAGKKTQLNPTDDRVLHLERKLRDVDEQRKDLAQQVIVLQRNASIIEALTDEMHKVIRPITPLPAAYRSTAPEGGVVEDLVMHLSDEHGDQVVAPHRVLGLEDYNFSVCMARAERYVETTLDFTQKTLKGYRFPTLWLLCYGDHSNGEKHEGTPHSHYRNIFKNCSAIGQLHALMIRDLAPHFERVNVLCLPGNHGFRGPKKEYRTAHNTWDYLVHATAYLMCRDHANVDFHIPDAYSAIVNIHGYNFHVNHGDDIKSWNSIPFYGIERKTRRLSTLHALDNRMIHYFVMGHFHQLTIGQHPGGETIVNGSFKMTDEYAMEALGAANRPSQLIHGVHPKYGITWRLPVYLKFQGDTNGPRRYKVRVGEE